MKQKYRFIFDLDGTLYRFSSIDNVFSTSQFYHDIKSKAYQFLAKRLGFSQSKAEAEYLRLVNTYKGEVSLAVEKEYGISRYEYFNNTWNLNPKDYLQSNVTLVTALSEFLGKSALLTAAPLVWAKAALSYLGIAHIFEERIVTGEQNIRKPNAQAFEQVVTALGVAPQDVFSIGDQEYSDIVPAQKLGMKTVLIGTPKETVPDFFAPDVLAAIVKMKKKGVL